MKNNSFLIIISILVLMIGTAAILSTNGKAGYSGAPGEGNCTSCHNEYAANSGTGSVVISTNIPVSGYELNTTYQISVIVSQVGKTLFGFDLEALSGTANAGTFIITNSNESQTRTKIVNTVTRNNVVHVSDGGLANDTKTFTFNWTSPATNAGNITFYATGNAANNDGNTTGDNIYTLLQK